MEESSHDLAKAGFGCPIPRWEKEASAWLGTLASVVRAQAGGEGGRAWDWVVHGVRGREAVRVVSTERRSSLQ